MSKVGRPRLPGVAQGGLRPPDGACGRSRPPARPYQNRTVVQQPGIGIPLDQPRDQIGIRQGGNLAQPLGARTGDGLGQPFGRLAVGDSTGDDELGEDDEIRLRQRGDLARDAIEIAGNVPSMRENWTTATRERRASGNGRMPYSPWNSRGSQRYVLSVIAP